MRLSVSKNSNGTWIASDHKNGNEKTDIIAVYRNLHNCSFIEAVKSLADKFGIRHSLGRGTIRYKPAKKPAPKKEAATIIWPDPEKFQRIKEQLDCMVECLGHSWLENVRKIKSETLMHPRFRGKILEENYNLAFPHVSPDKSGKWFVCGYERRIFYKDQANSGFAGGGKRGLWFSHASTSDRKLIIFESALNALSYFQIHGTDACYVSIGGTLAGLQKAIIKRLIAKGKRLVLAFDNDDSGEGYAKEIESFRHVKGQIRRAFPPGDFSDWNDVLREKKKCGSEKVSKTKFGVQLQKS